MNRNEAAASCWAEINMGAMIENYKTALSFLSSETTLIPVLKANAYGCGAEYVSQALYHEGARLFAVASLLEAVEIKRALPTDADVLVLGLVSLPELPRAIHENLVLTGFSVILASSRLMSPAYSSLSSVSTRMTDAFPIMAMALLCPYPRK